MLVYKWLSLYHKYFTPFFCFDGILYQAFHEVMVNDRKRFITHPKEFPLCNNNLKSFRRFLFQIFWQIWWVYVVSYTHGCLKNIAMKSVNILTKTFSGAYGSKLNFSFSYLYSRDVVMVKNKKMKVNSGVTRSSSLSTIHHWDDFFSGCSERRTKFIPSFASSVNSKWIDCLSMMSENFNKVKFRCRRSRCCSEIFLSFFSGNIESLWWKNKKKLKDGMNWKIHWKLKRGRRVTRDDDEGEPVTML